MSLKPLTCKICGHVIPEPPVIIGEPEGARQAKTIQTMMQHLNEAAAAEIRTRQCPPHAPHAEAMGLVIANTGTISNYLMAANFDLPEELEATREWGRHSIHAATRKVRMTDEDLQKIVEQEAGTGIGIWQTPEKPRVFELLGDLRDRYEEIGRYAPTAPQTVGSAGNGQ